MILEDTIAVTFEHFRRYVWIVLFLYTPRLDWKHLYARVDGKLFSYPKSTKKVYAKYRIFIFSGHWNLFSFIIFTAWAVLTLVLIARFFRATRRSAFHWLAGHSKIFHHLTSLLFFATTDLHLQFPRAFPSTTVSNSNFFRLPIHLAATALEVLF